MLGSMHSVLSSIRNDMDSDHDDDDHDGGDNGDEKIHPPIYSYIYSFMHLSMQHYLLLHHLYQIKSHIISIIYTQQRIYHHHLTFNTTASSLFIPQDMM